MSFTDELIEKAKKLNKRVVLPETQDDRTLRAAARLAKDCITQVTLIGVPDAVCAQARGLGVDVSGCEILNPLDEQTSAPLAAQLYELRKSKGLTPEQAREQIKCPLYFSTMLLKLGRVDAYIAGGGTHSTGEKMRPPLQIVKTAPGIKMASSFFLMVHPDTRWGEKGVMLYSDCAITEQPTAEQLADIAVASAKSFRQLVGAEPRVAMLSYSTKGSAKSPDVEKVVKAVALAKQLAPELVLDGEIQFDAAVIPAIGERKCKGSPVAGRANCFIFPDLDAGNIGYKITERIGGAMAVGPMMQGLAKPAHDLSRGCSAEDIVMVSAVGAVMAV